MVEEISASKKSSLAVVESAYEQAIATVANDQGLGPNMLACVNQRAGLALAERNGEVSEVDRYLTKAMELHRNGWGSTSIYHFHSQKRETILLTFSVAERSNSARSNLPPVVGTMIQVHAN
jgi:hypothetical protein